MRLRGVSAITRRGRPLPAGAPTWRPRRPAPASGTYLEPFGLRTLGLVRGDRSLLESAAARFDGMGLAWHAERTGALALEGDERSPERPTVHAEKARIRAFSRALLAPRRQPLRTLSRSKPG